jgi:hypothetical protein
MKTYSQSSICPFHVCCNELRKSNSYKMRIVEIYNWNAEYSTITLIIVVISSTVHRPQDDPYWKCEKRARAIFRGDWHVATIHAESNGTVPSLPARASRNAQGFVYLGVCVLLLLLVVAVVVVVVVVIVVVVISMFVCLCVCVRACV